MNALYFIPVPILYVAVSSFFYGRIIGRYGREGPADALLIADCLVLIMAWPLWPLWWVLSRTIGTLFAMFFRFNNRLFDWARRMGERSVR